MKTPLSILLLLASLALPAWAQSTLPSPAQKALDVPSAAKSYHVTQRGPNHRVWAKAVLQTNALGRVTVRTNSYVELATGMHFRDAAGQWQETKEQISLLPNGVGATATNGPHQVVIPADIYEGAIEVTSLDKKRLRTRPLGIAYFDGTNSVLIAELTNSIGQILPPGNKVIYTNAFTGLEADLICTYRKSGFECDLAFRSRPPSPESVGLSAAHCRLQVLTEVFDSAPSLIRRGMINPADGLTDTSVAFGTLSLARGKAFSIGGASNSVAAPRSSGKAATRVYKSWEKLIDENDGQTRTFLIEEVPYGRVQKELNELGYASKTTNWLASGNARHSLSPVRQLTAQRAVRVGTNELQLARAEVAPQKAFILDWLAVCDSTNNFTFNGDTTYYVSAPFSVTGTATFEGGVVIKFPEDGDGIVWIQSSVKCQTSDYRPAILTSVNDNSVGDTISGKSTGNPRTGFSPYLWIDLPEYSPNSGALGSMTSFNNLRFSYADTAVTFNAYFVPNDSPDEDIDPSSNWNYVTFTNCQFVRCSLGVSPETSWGPFKTIFNNCLFVNTLWGPAWCLDEVPYFWSFRNCTLDGVQMPPCGAVNVSARNCIFANGSSYGQASSGYNGFYNSPAFGDHPVVSSTSPFQSSAAGNYYLTENCGFRNTGTTNVDGGLLAELRKKTTFPPIVYSNTTISVDTVFAPQAQRDTDLPDLGYHYNPLDFCFADTFVSNATLTVLPGTAVGVYPSDFGIMLLGDAPSVKCLGKALAPVHFADLRTVQEHSIPASAYHHGWLTFYSSTTPSGLPSAAFNFTKWSALAGPTGFYINTPYQPTAPFVFANCEFGAGSFNSFISLNVTNCLFERTGFYLGDLAQGSDLYFFNNLFRGGNILFDHGYGAAWVFRDNVFDNVSLDEWGGPTEYHHNAFIGSTPYIGGVIQPGDQALASLAWQAGPLGDYYLPPDSPLIDAGSTNADQLGLYYYTTQTNLVDNSQVSEGNSKVDIGYHYVAVDANGVPLDRDGNGVSDYLEDANGNGVPDWLEVLMGFDPHQANNTGRAAPGYNLFLAQPRENSQLP